MMIHQDQEDQNQVRFFPSACLLFAICGVLLVIQKTGFAKPNGKLIYEKNCAACHGIEGRGAPSSQVGFDVPLPDFTDCSFISREPDADWVIVAQEGGPVRGFSEIMPAFGDALTEAELQAAIDHIRGFCDDSEWPRGEFNLPRALNTTKAYPEDELVLSSSFRSAEPGKLTNKLIYEKRFGARNQFELIVPYGWSEQTVSGSANSHWQSGVGDIGVALKRVMYHSLQTGSIVSLGGELFLPTGEKERGFGSDTTYFEPYLAYGQLLPDDYFVQAQLGAVLPYNTEKKHEKAFWRAVVGRSFSFTPAGRTWSPMVEIMGSRELRSGLRTDWDVIPQLQVSLNTRQHILLGLGVKLPLNDTDQRKTVAMLYLLWDWFDGGLFDGW